MTTINRADINDLLSQMRDMKAQAQAQPKAELGRPMEGGLNSEVKEVPKFGEMFKQAVDSVNDTQKTAKTLADAYQMGDPKVSLSQVMVAAQKSSVSFQALSQVRNRLVQAYQDVMKMPI